MIAQLCVNNISMVICSVLDVHGLLNRFYYLEVHVDVKPLKSQLHRNNANFLCLNCVMVILSCSKWFVLIQTYTFLKIIVKILKLG